MKFLRCAVPAGLALIAWGCGGAPSAPEYAPRRPRTVSIEWLGHHSFLVTSSLGVRLLTDPYAPGTVPHRFRAGVRPDVLVISREDPQSNHDAAVENIPRTFRSKVALGSNTAYGIPIEGRPAGDSVAFTWRMDGIRFCFPGAAASLPENTGPADVLFLPVGSRLPPSAQERLLAGTKPRVIIPMGPPRAVEAWAARFGAVHRVTGSRLLLNRETLPSAPVAALLPVP